MNETKVAEIFTEEQLEMVTNAAKEVGLSVAEYVVRATMFVVENGMGG